MSSELYDRNHAKRKLGVSYTQQKHLYEFLNMHPDVAVGYHKSSQAREHCKRLWSKAAAILNNMDEGSAIKSASGWAKYWVDLKAKIKIKIRLNQEANEMGNPTDLELTAVEIKFLSIIDPDYESNYSNIHEISLSPSAMSSDDENKNDTERTEPYILHPVKRRRNSQSEVLEYAIKEESESITVSKLSELDEYTSFGIHIANQLRTLSSLELYINAQDEIQTILTRYRLEDLSKRSHSQ